MDFSPFEFSENTLKFSNILNGSEVKYRLISPSVLHLRKRNETNVVAAEVSSKRVKSESSRKRRGRPRKIQSKRSVDEKQPDDAGEPSTRNPADTTPLSRTRYGRVTRPPKHMSRFIDINEPATAAAAAEDLASDAFGTTIEAKINTFQPEKTIVSSEQQNGPKKIRRNLERFTCGVCRKIYLGKKKMLSHLKAFPDHKMPFDIASVVSNGFANGLPTSPTNSLLFNELTRSLSNVMRNERCKYLLDELSNFAMQINVLKGSLLPSCTSEYVDHRPHYVDKNVGQLLGIQEGNYNLNESVLEHFQCQMQQKISSPFNAIGSTLPSVVSIQPSNYDLVPINEVNFDQITDNAMEAVSLDKILIKDSDVTVTSPILDISLFRFNGT